MTWTVTLHPEDGFARPRVVDGVIKYEILNIVRGRKVSKFAIFTLAGGGHLTVIFDVGSRKDQVVYRKFDIHNKFGNFVVGHRAANGRVFNHSSKLL